MRPKVETASKYCQYWFRYILNAFIVWNMDFIREKEEPSRERRLYSAGIHNTRIP